MPPSRDTSFAAAPWRVALDTGGTFTDLVAVDPEGRTLRAKIPSDGSLVAAASGMRAPRVVGVVAAGGLDWPDGLLVGWTMRSGMHDARIVGHEAGAVVLDRDLELPRDASLRFTSDHAPIDAPRLGLHLLTRTPLGRALPPIEIRLSTTRGTNALLEGRGARVGVLVSDGLTGVVEIGDQTRDRLFARVPAPRRVLAHAVRALPERTLADGTARLRANAADIERACTDLRAAGCDRFVVSLAHALVDGGREAEVAASLSACGVPAVAASQIAPHPRLLTRTETAVVSARVAPALEAFVADATRSAHAGSRECVFTSAGVLQSAQRFAARDTLFSGPAGGARAVCAVAERHAIAAAIGFDMGGTSSDVTRAVRGRVAMRSETRLARTTVAAPALAIDSVAAGGGSICRVRDGAFE
ncbi:MAG: hydantoinase/oxoprolinase family protein, partial [Planctomycetota bacterium]